MFQYNELGINQNIASWFPTDWHIVIMFMYLLLKKFVSCKYMFYIYWSEPGFIRS